MMSIQKGENGLVRFFKWLWQGLERTIFVGIKFTYPSRFVSPLGFLGMLTFIVFIILGITGALLMFYYEPILDRAWDSVKTINNTIPYGFHIRNIHYHASNAMVFLALAHMYYQYFSGRYKIRNEVLWVTGVILGTVTILEAFTGYDIIYNERAELAISIASSLTNSIPVIGPELREIVFGAGFADFVLRFYALHVFILPIVMLGLMAVHFPRFLVFDVPMVMAVAGMIFIVAGVFPVELGNKFDPTVPPDITVPEWYLTGIYAFLRTQYDKFVTGVLWPGLFIAALAMIPFIDRYKKLSWKDRPLITAIGITSLAQIIVTTYWGFYIDPDFNKPLLDRIVIDPILFYTVMLLLVPLSFGFTYMMIKLAKHFEELNKKEAAARKAKGGAGLNISIKWGWWLLVVLLAFQVYLNIAAYYAGINGFKNVQLFIIGLVLVTFAGVFHLYRYLNEQAKKAKPIAKPTPKEPTPRPVIEHKEEKKEVKPVVEARVQASTVNTMSKPTSIASSLPSSTQPSTSGMASNPNPSLGSNVKASGDGSDII
ncbi:MULTISPECIES: cytochrome b [Candidatus Nitrosocaldus]|jgi:ubiquinol-cytochrome c reductase cytochrome b subunit|uniref:Putative cytochrome b/b6 n=1 Tax=Candidatus Nitrosocaldus cavascurensis TaxID=2058097 RepID=A0A2K5AP22_9ARCH|nr:MULTISPECIES: cytochrome b N-terminal domain-containing protein [Candidatus Nitrosocaldus]SPC33391.1 putative cytochrome b/b6 [Candidatus Nitrosocaldus cavascurensis]